MTHQMATGRALAKPFPVERRDRAWLGTQLITVVGPFDMPPLDDVRAAVERVVRENPRTRIDWDLDADRMRWTPSPLPDSIVVEGRWESGIPVDEIFSRLADDRAVRSPLGFVRYPQHLGMVVDHAVNDGRGCCAVVESIAAAALTGDYEPVEAEPAGRYPLLSAVARTFGPHPSKLREALADRPERDAHAAGEREVPWQPSRRTLVATINRSVRGAMIAREKKQGGKATPFAILALATLRALRASGISVSEDVTVAVDLRAYIDLRWIDGNFSGAGRLRVSAATSATEMSSMIGKAIQSGRPLAGQVLDSIRTGGRWRAAEVPNSMNPDTTVKVTFSDVGRRNPLPYKAGRSPEYFISLPAFGTHGMTVGFVHTPEAVLVSASFNDNAIEAGRVQSALSNLASGSL